MKAERIVFLEPYKVILEDFELTESPLGPKELLIKTLYSVISAGTEGASFTGLEREVPGIGEFRYPRYPGYGNVGEVLAVGSEVSGYQVGDIVLSTAPHASHWKVNTEGVCIKVPEGLSPQIAVFARMAAVAITAARKADFSLGDSVLVIGMGLVGNFAAQLSLMNGADVMAVDISDFRLQRAKECGIEHTVNPQREELKKAVMDWTKEKGAQIVIEAVGKSELIASAVELTRCHGEVILLGSPRKRVTMDVTPMLFRMHVQGIMMKGSLEWLYQIPESDFVRHSIIGNLRKLLGWLLSGALKTSPLLTHLLPPSECQEAYDGLDKRKDEYLGVVFNWG
ncbi:TPA: zinc-binding alcohol dehydrogenase [Candidatus Poribacteria bacterium]|nr:zinc-binding alcohol dehydrogenase [Candidatus Poribacteria bacterium]